MSIADSLNELIKQKKNLAINLTKKGVSANQNETYTSLVPKVLQINTYEEMGGDLKIPKQDWYVLFINSNGEIIAKWNEKQLAAATSLPTIQEREGLTFDKWNYTLGELKSRGIPTVVGALYQTNETIIEFVVEANKQVQLLLSDYEEVTIDWGDGQVETTVSTTLRHTYSNSGVTIIKVSGTSYSIGGLLFNGVQKLLFYTSDWSAAMLLRLFVGAAATSIKAQACRELNYLSEVILPEGLELIGANAFRACKGLTSIIIPPNCELGDYCFWECSGLTSVSFSNGTTTIPQYCFNYCGSLINLGLPTSLTQIKRNGFDYCRRLRFVSLPPALTSIERNAFSDCNLASVIVPENVNLLGQAVFRGNKTLKLAKILGPIEEIPRDAFLGCECLVSVVVPNSVKSINSDAFMGCAGLTSFIISNYGSSSTETEDSSRLGANVFYSCPALRRVDVPKTCSLIGDAAFNNCHVLTDIYLPEGLTALSRSTFLNCHSLEKISIPSTLTTIPNQCFCQCSSLKEVQIPNSITTIEGAAFQGCQALQKIEIPESVTELQYNAFENTGLLDELVLKEGLTTIGSNCFSSCWQLTSIVFPSTVTNLDTSCFSGCVNLKKVEFKGGLTSLTSYLFRGCYSIEQVKFNSLTPPAAIDSQAFADLPIKCKIYVPAAALEDYKNAVNMPNPTIYTYVGF